VTSDGRSLALVAARLVGEASGGLARLVLEQRFENAYDENLRVTYRMPLPADGAISGYEFVIGERTVKGVIDKKAQARERFERAIASGKTAALLEQERADIFTQQIGNIPARAAVLARITIDQRLVWLPEGEWELRFPTVIGPRYIGSADTAADVRATHIKVTDQPLRAGIQIAIAVRDTIVGGGAPMSPSHRVDAGSDGTCALHSAARLDRDIVLRWRVATPAVGLSLATARRAQDNDAFGLLTIVPPAAAARVTPVPRDLIVLLDTSGSMGGGPLDKAKQVIGMMIDSLDERDRFELIEFSNEPRRYLEEPQIATAKAKQGALKWLRSREADGATEMRTAVIEAMTTLRVGAQRQIVVVTDGYVGGEHQILEALNRRLPKSCRLHVLGVGSAVNRSLATSLSRAGRGVEVLVGVDEDAERGAKRLLDRTRMPVLTNVEISGSALLRHAPDRIPDVFEGAPLVAAVAVRAEGGELVVRGQLATETWEQTIRVPAQAPGTGSQAIVALYGRERVADVEANALFHSVDGEIEELGLTFQIATKMTSWVAVDEASKVTGPSRDQLIPQELPYGTSAGAFGLRAPAAAPVMAPAAPMMMKTMAGTLKYAAEDRSFDVRAPAGSYEGGADEGDFDEEAPREVFGSDDAVRSMSRDDMMYGYAEEKKEAEADDFEAEAETGEIGTPAQAELRRIAPFPTAATPLPPRAVFHVSSLPPAGMRPSASQQPGPVPEPTPEPTAQPEAKARRITARGMIAPSPELDVVATRVKAQAGAPGPAPERRRSTLSVVVWLAVLLALIALLVWWLAA
jgi:Ca-activated chloride channel family protein